MDIALAVAEESNLKELLWESALIKKVKEHPQLYDFNHKDYKEALRSNHTWISVAEQLGMPGRWKICKEKWRALRDTYVRKRKGFLMGKDRGKWPRWKFFDQMNFLHTYICHRPDREQAPHGLSIHWEDGKSDCDSNDESSPPHETEKESGIIFEDVSIKREEEEEEEEEDESVRVTKRARLSNNLSTMQEENMRNSALEDFDAEISRETDPLSFTEDGQTIKEELEWGDEEMDEEDQSLIKEEAAVTSPTESPTPPPKPLPPPPPLALADNKRPMVVQFNLPGGKSVPATFFSEANTELISRKVGMIMPKPMSAVPIKIKTVSSNQMRSSGFTPVVSSPSFANSQQTPNIPILKENLKQTSSHKPSTVSSLCPDPVPEAAEGSASEEGLLEDEEELFGRYIAAAIRKLTRKSQSRAKMLIQQVLYKMEEFDRDNEVNGKDPGVADSREK